MLKLFIIASIILCPTCSIGLQDNARTVDRTSSIDDLIHNGIGIEIFKTENEMIQEMGKPLHVEEKSVGNKYYGLHDTLITYKYRGLNVVFYHHNSPRSAWKALSTLTVSSNDYALKYNIRIGMPLQVIYEMFGKGHYPIREINNEKYVSYYPSSTLRSDTEQVIFVFENDFLIKLIWSSGVPD